PVTNAVQGGLGGFRDAIVFKLDSSGTNLVYATYLGGARVDLAYRLAVDAAGCAYVTGATASTNFPSTPGAFNRGGIFHSFDAGTNWNSTSAGLTHATTETVVSDPFSPGTLYAGSSRGVFKTTDGGAHWSGMNTGLISRGVLVLGVDPSHAGTIYAGTQAGLFVSTNSALTWSISLASVAVR